MFDAKYNITLSEKVPGAERTEQPLYCTAFMHIKSLAYALVKGDYGIHVSTKQGLYYWLPYRS